MKKASLIQIMVLALGLSFTPNLSLACEKDAKGGKHDHSKASTQDTGKVKAAHNDHDGCDCDCKKKDSGKKDSHGDSCPYHSKKDKDRS